MRMAIDASLPENSGAKGIADRIRVFLATCMPTDKEIAAAIGGRFNTVSDVIYEAASSLASAATAISFSTDLPPWEEKN